ncbi:MAG: Poly-beta-hydroxybutyrate polymerase domain protein [Solirubrobacterales bacterium]|nr:Poly-beta-hydroxybutyrate polymerase domain protein [Solirubrobacterales bacterium]
MHFVRAHTPSAREAIAAVPDSLEGAERLDALRALADLADPGALAAESVRVATGLALVAIGASDAAPSPTDRRFSDPAWSENLLYRRWMQAYLVWADAVQRLASTPRLREDWRRESRARAAATKLVDAAAPNNVLLGNPTALKRAFDTGGSSLLRGWRNALHDLRSNGGMPSQVDRRPFKVGESLAATPGSVIYRDDLFELLEYRPTTARVRSQPLLMVPPQINKHYFLDLAPGRSLTEYLVGRGIHYFTMVWRNPGSEHGHWGIDDYVAAQLRAMDVVREVSGSDRLGLLGACAGGLTNALMLGHLVADGGAEAVSSATFAISMLDTRYPNPVGAIATERTLEAVAGAAARGEVFEGEHIARAFAWMRPNDLVFNYVVNNWLLGDDPPAFDILAWNNDGANLPSQFYSDMLDVYAHNRAATPGAIEVLGTPIDLARVDCDNFVVAGMKDHLTPWMPGYMTSQLLGGRSEVVVTTTGHIQTMVNPPGKPRARYFAGPEPGPDPEAWMAEATAHDGSWWPLYADWLLTRSGEDRDAPTKPGSRRHRPIEPAPGSYVLE